MPIVVVTRPLSRALCTVDRVMAEIDGLTDRARAADLIDEATGIIERACQRPYGFGLAEYDERLDADGDFELQVEVVPLVRVASVMYAGVAVQDYEIIDTEQGLLHRDIGWQMSSVIDTFTRVVRSRYDFALRYAAGYRLPNDDEPFVCADTVELDDVADDDQVAVQTLPYDLERACIELVRALFVEAPAVTAGAVVEERIGDHTVRFADRSSDPGLVLPPRVERLIGQYRKVY